MDVKVDFQKLFNWPGAFIDFRSEMLYGDFVNKHSGDLLGVNSIGLFPAPDEDDIVVSKLTFTQFLSETFGLFIGRYDSLDGDGNHFASGRGRTQFINVRFNASPTNARTTPYVLEGGGFIVFTPNLFTDQKGLLIVGIGDPEVMPDESFLGGDFMDEQYYWFEYLLPTHFFDKPGSLLIGANMNTKPVTDLSEIPEFDFPPPEPGTPSITPNQKDDSWVVYFGFHQYLYIEAGQEIKGKGYHPNTELLQGIGIFGRFSVADADTNPFEYFYEIGLGGRGVIPNRDNDTFGVGVYYTSLSDVIKGSRDLLRDDTWGVEVFYNIEVFPWLHITPDFQIGQPSFERVDSGYVAGIRFKIDL
jgi:porin